ncbi:MAG: TIGR03086 family protein, partial [Propionibacteriales bacterium]|nr:TIGR03086 family protein [Propionibacteriales bacterium]
GPTAQQLATLLRGVTDDQLTAQTPCDGYTLGDLIDHIGGLSQAFTAAATKDLGPATAQGPSGDATRLAPDWRVRIPQQLGALAEAWRKPDAWEGMTRAGGIDLPADVAGKVALNELLIHGWDVARASGQPFDVDPPALDASMEFVSMMSTPEEEAGRDGLFGPIVDVPDAAPLLDRTIGLSGRDPSWRAT